MMVPMSQLVCDRKSSSSKGTAVVDRNNGLVVVADDACLTAIERAEPNTRTGMVRKRFKVNLTWLSDS